MSDNRTIELQSLSKLKKAGKLHYWRGTIEMPESELHAICDEIQAEHDHVIAATLGRDTSAARLVESLHGIADEMRSIGASTMTPHELLACYAREVDKVADSLVFATTLGSGTLTAEQVRKVMHDCSKYPSWQAIAEELNAVLGSDGEYEAKMDALLCRLTNGKWSKSRAYDLDFMEQCINEEFETLYAKEQAEYAGRRWSDE